MQSLSTLCYADGCMELDELDFWRIPAKMGQYSLSSVVCISRGPGKTKLIQKDFIFIFFSSHILHCRCLAKKHTLFVKWVHKPDCPLRVQYISSNQSQGSLGFWRLKVHCTSRMKPFYACFLLLLLFCCDCKTSPDFSLTSR